MRFHQSPGKSLHQHKQHSENERPYGHCIIELYQELSYISVEAPRFSDTFPKVIPIDEEQLQLLLISKRKGIAVSPEQEHRNAEYQREQPASMFI